MVKVVQRPIHSFMDILRDVGGALFTLLVVSMFLNSILTYNKMENWLVQNLYLRPETKSSGADEEAVKDLDANA